jgi:putative glutamine amidotransferase
VGKPTIAITFGSTPKPSDEEYLDAIEKAGGNPVLFRLGNLASFDDFQGLLLSGGEDIDPAFYGETKESFCDEVDRHRDEFEFFLFKEFVKQRKPVLAICRGIQLVNVALGGSLYQDLEKQFASPLHPSHKSQEHLTREQKRALRHGVKIEKDSLLYSWFGEEVTVNSRHHQAIKALAPGLKIAAFSEDGIIEGVEMRNGMWILGVQWHPEAREVHKDFVQIFEGFVRACNEGKRNAVSSSRTNSGVYLSAPYGSGA